MSKHSKGLPHYQQLQPPVPMNCLVHTRDIVLLLFQQYGHRSNIKLDKRQTRPVFSMTNEHQLPKHPIQVVSRRTGLSSDVIRAWERRYAAVEPQRANNGRRLYSDIDIEKLSLLRRATSAGRRIGDIASETLEQLYALVETDDQAAAQSRNLPSERPNTGSVMEYFEECLDAVHNLSPNTLKTSLNNAAKNLGTPFLLEDLLRPLMAYIRDECRRGNMRIAQERLATSVLRSYMGAMAISEGTEDLRYKLVVSTPIGQSYDLIALRMAAAAQSYGWGPIYLDTELPVEELAYTAEQIKAQAIALGIARPNDDPHLPNILRSLRSKIDASTRIIVCGDAVSGYTEVMQEINAIAVQTMGELRMELDRLRKPITAFIEDNNKQ